MVPPPRSGSFSPNPVQALQTGISHSPHPLQGGAISAGASPSTGSPIGSSSLTKIVVAQVYLLLSTIKEETDPKYPGQANQLRKLIDEHGMEVFSRYFTRLVAGNAPQIFSGLNRPLANPANYHILVNEMRKIAHDVDQAGKIAESIESATEDIFRDFDLSTFMEHFKLDALEKTLLALAFKQGSRADLKTKADAILSTNFSTFVNILSRADLVDHADLTPGFIALIIDRFIQFHPPTFNAASKAELAFKVQERYSQPDQSPPSEVLAALDLVRVLSDKPSNALTLYVQKIGSDFTRDEDTSFNLLQKRPSSIQLTEEQVSSCLVYCAISQNPRHSPIVLVAALRRILPSTFRWNKVVAFFDQRNSRISSEQFLRLYQALLPIAREATSSSAPAFDIAHMWGGSWDNPEAHLSFICAFASLSPDQLDASTIPGLVPTITIDSYADSPKVVKDRASVAVRHPLVSVEAMRSVFTVALNSVHASQSVEAKRLFQEVVVPNLDVFVVSAFGVPKPWPEMALDTLNSLFDNFLHKRSPEYEFVLDSLWRKDRDFVKARLVDAHANKPTDLALIFEHAIRHHWLEQLIEPTSGFGLDLAALAHAEGRLDLTAWAKTYVDRSHEIVSPLFNFLMIKATLELQYQRPLDGQMTAKSTTTLQVKTVSALLQILEDFLPPAPVRDLILVQRSCITAYPRLINYGEEFDDIIDANSRNGNALPVAANSKMEEHYKRMYGDEIQVRDIVEILNKYKHSREPLDQDVFACMIHGLFDEYNHYKDYPLEALATTAVLFGGIISHKLISDLPLKIGLGMILQAVQENAPEQPMFKFGLQALMQLFPRFREWPGFCKQLLQVNSLRGTDAWKKAEECVRDHEDELSRTRNGAAPNPLPSRFGSDGLTNGLAEDGTLASERPAPPFASICIDLPRRDVVFEDPGPDEQGKIQFVLNNITETTLKSMCLELRDMIERKHQQWFASHLVEERAKMQPNYHSVYLELVNLFEDSKLSAEVLRETYTSVARLLNAESTMQNSTERTHLKNLGGWLGLLTLARDKPIKQKNIAFKQLLIEAHDTKRLVVVIPFVCKVLIQGAASTVFRPPNPWLMDIIYLLIELYHHAELKLNLKFEIEVLCKGLSLDHKSIEPSGEILNRVAIEDASELMVDDGLDGFTNLAIHGLAPVGAPGLSPQTSAPVVPDVGPMVTIPPTNDMLVSASKLHEIVSTALTRALDDIIQPVVDRSVTIAAISTQQMIHKDFSIEPDEERVKQAAMAMVKATAGSLALVTSKEPLRANFTNYMRNLSSDLPQGLPEGTIIMCVNSNLDLGCGIIERQAAERAVPEIEDMLEPELESRRRHRLEKPNEPWIGLPLDRWAGAIPPPYRLTQDMRGLTAEQMAIYEDFARQPRSITAAPASHTASASDATRSLANEVLQEQFSVVPGIPTPSETPSLHNLGSQLQYPSITPATTANGRPFQMDLQVLVNRFSKFLLELRRVATEAREEHFSDLPRPHPVLDVVDAIMQLIIKTSQSSEEFSIFAAEQISQLLFGQIDDSLALESLVHVLEALRSISGLVVSERVKGLFQQQPGRYYLNLPLLTALGPTDLVDWKQVDIAMADVIRKGEDGSLTFLQLLLDLALSSDRPLALYADFVKTLEAVWPRIMEEPDSATAQRLRSKLGLSLPKSAMEDNTSYRHDQMEYVFEEWIHLCQNPNASEKSFAMFVQQLQVHSIISSKDDFFQFVRLAVDHSMDRFEPGVSSSGGRAESYMAVDALAKFIGIYTKMYYTSEIDTGDGRPVFFESVVGLIVLILHHHHMKREEHFDQKRFFRLLTLLLYEVNSMDGQVPENERLAMLLGFASRLADVNPRLVPGFVYGWIALLQNRVFLPVLLASTSGAVRFTVLLRQLVDYLAEQLMATEVTPVAKDIYRATLKLLAILQHDFPEYIIPRHNILCRGIPPHCSQLMATVLATIPSTMTKLPDPLHPNFKLERVDELHEAPALAEDYAGLLRQHGLLEAVNQLVRDGISDGPLAQLVLAIGHGSKTHAVYGFVSVTVDTELVDAVVMHAASTALERQLHKGGPVYVAGSPDVELFTALARQLHPEARYYVLSCIINQLRYPNAHTYYFAQVVWELFGASVHDGGDMEIAQQITRILLERLLGFWQQPWGLMVTVMELLKNETYMFFDLPFIKSAPEVMERFATLLRA